RVITCRAPFAIRPLFTTRPRHSLLTTHLLQITPATSGCDLEIERTRRGPPRGHILDPKPERVHPGRDIARQRKIAAIEAITPLALAKVRAFLKILIKDNRAFVIAYLGPAGKPDGIIFANPVVRKVLQLDIYFHPVGRPEQAVILPQSIVPESVDALGEAHLVNDQTRPPLEHSFETAQL